MIGGHRNQRYLKRIGEDFYVLPRLWNVQAQEWQSWPGSEFTWKRQPYSVYCMGCHVTAFDPQANVPYAEARVGCEACHGPGWAHVQAAGKGPIVHPGKLSEERRDMICAACHVRGKDRSGNYYFPVGYVPGEDLGRYYEPFGRDAGKPASAAIVEEFQAWKKRREAKEGDGCDVCRIPGTQQVAKTGIDYCFGCHPFRTEKRDRYPEHTRHPARVALDCADCHVQKEREALEPAKPDVHSYGYFLLHADKCYDPLVHRACGRCHQDRGEEWARRTVERWRAPAPIDH